MKKVTYVEPPKPKPTPAQPAVKKTIGKPGPKVEKENLPEEKKEDKD